MNIKKLIAPAVTVLAVMAATTCFAQISKSELNIGGIYYGQPWPDFIATYGQPIRKDKRPPAGYNNVFRYGNFEFIANPMGKDNYVCEVLARNNCAFATKAGIHIGSTSAEVQAAYGMPDRTFDSGRFLEYFTGWESYDIGDGNSMDIQPELSFNFYRPGGRVDAFGFHVIEDWENMYPTGSKSPRHQEKPKPSAPPKPMSTIPSFVTEMPKTELSIGGIEPGQDIGYTEQIYGKPGKFEDEGFIHIYNYNDKFVVRAKMNHGFKVTSVAIYEKGLKTPGGFTVGIPYDDVVKKYGRVNGIKFKGEGVEAKLKGCTDYTYFSGDKQTVFLVDKKGIVQAIRVEDLDEQKFIEAKRK